MAELLRGGDGVLRKSAMRPNGFGVEKRRRFLDELARTCSVASASRAAGVYPQTAYRLRRRDGEFARLWLAAMEEGQVRLEEELLAVALGQIAGDNPDGERTPGETTRFDPDLALKVLALRARTPGRGTATKAAAAPSQGEIDAALMKRLRAFAGKTARR